MNPGRIKNLGKTIELQEVLWQERKIHFLDLGSVLGKDPPKENFTPGLFTFGTVQGIATTGNLSCNQGLEEKLDHILFNYLEAVRGGAFESTARYDTTNTHFRCIRETVNPF